MFPHSGFLTFRVDPLLSGDSRRHLESVLVQFENSEIKDLDTWTPEIGEKLIIDFVAEGSLHLLKQGQHLKICLMDQNQGLFSFGQNIEASLVDAVLDESFDVNHLSRLLTPALDGILDEKESELSIVGAKNLRKFENFTRKSLDESKFPTPESFMTYTQSLVDLEKDLIHADDLSKMEKILRLFAKTHLEKAKFSLIKDEDLSGLVVSKNFILLPKYKGEFLAIELNWEDLDSAGLVKKYFFLSTLIGFFSSQKVIQDPFFDEALWEDVLNSIPFPVALLSLSAEVYQHNSLFAKLNFAPQDCLRLKVREKIIINDIPYNVFRKEVFHMDEQKILLVFFTESFFVKGDGNHTPTGQELGIISSSIAHELNNPIAGIQAALTLLMLDEELNEEARLTLEEMKNGAYRCKQLVETFLGFSRANPLARQNLELKLSPIEVCYQQAQNLLRFRTVESGIRLQLEYSKHADFRTQVNLSLLTMTFYLILGELMTLYSHQLLVSSKNQIEKVIKGEIVESSQEIQIQLHELNISTLTLSKLIQNLLNIENFVLQVSDYGLRFIYSPARN